MATKEIIPVGWQKKKLRTICTYSKGKKPKTLSQKKTDHTPIPYINIKAFEKGIFDEYTDGDKCNICDEGDLLMVWDGARAGFTGKAKKGAIGSTLMKIQPIDELNKEFLFYYLQSLYRKLNTNPRGVGIPHVEPTLLWDAELLLPDLITQQTIVSKIEELFSELDKGIEDLKLAQQQLKIYRQSVLKHAFEGRLTNENVKEGELPEGWEWKKISEICNVVRGGSPRPAGDLRFYNGNIPFLKVKDVTKDSNMFLTSGEHTIKEAGLHKTRKISPHTLLLSNSGATLGVPKICMIDATINDGIAAFLNLDKRSNSFLYFFWLSKTKELRNINMGAAQPNLNTDLIKNYDVPYCQFDEQNLVVQEIESRLSVADKLEVNIIESLEKAEALRQSILKKAFSGELIAEVKSVEVPKIKNEYFHQLQLVALVINGSKKKKIDHGEMTLAKNLYLLDAIYNVPTGFKYDRWHLGPYPPALKKVVNNREYFTRNGNYIEVQNEEKLLKYNISLQDQITGAIDDLSSIFSKYKGAERSHKTELLATVCKAIEDIKSTDLGAVRESMQEWKIDLKNSKFRNKAKKFNEAETKKCIEFIIERGWDKRLINGR